MVTCFFRHFKKPLDIVAEFIPQVCVVGIQYSAEVCSAEHQSPGLNVILSLVVVEDFFWLGVNNTVQMVN